MSIKIEKIDIENLGPIQKLSVPFKNINLVYSKNECGKSFLVEFIIRSLFSKKTQWGYNREMGQGKITISGIDTKPKNYFPNSKDKLDKYFEKNLKVLPVFLSKLLIIKGGESNISETPEGIDINTLKEMISSKSILDSIDNKISATVKKGLDNNNKINIPNTGEGKEYYDLIDKLNKINDLIKKISYENKISDEIKYNIELRNLNNKKTNLLKARYYKAYILDKTKKELENNLNKYPDAKLSDIQKLINEYSKLKDKSNELIDEEKKLTYEINKLIDVPNKYDKQIKAKHHLAYDLDKQINNLKNELNKITDDDINKLDNDINNYDKYQKDYNNKFQEFQKLSENEKNYNWINNVKNTYEKLIQNVYNTKTGITFLVISSIIFITGLIIVFAAHSLVWGSALLIVAFGLSVYFAVNFKKQLKFKPQNDELAKLEKEFKEKFNQELNEANLNTIIEQLKEENIILGRIKGDLNQLKIEIDTLNSIIKNKMFQIFSNYVEENNWLSKLNDFKENRKTKKTQLEKLEKQLAKLNVDTSDYYQNNIDEEYSDIKLSELEKKVTVLDNLENERQKIQNTLKDINNKLLELCGKINSEFQNLINTKLTESEWENKLNELNAKNINIKDEINKISGELNGISVNPSDYIEENPGVEYDAKKYAEIEKEIQQIEDKLKELEKENIELKSEIANLTDTSSTSNWEILTEKLYEKQKEISNSIKQKEAFIIAGYLLHTTIETLRNKEDEQIQNAVNSEYFSNLLFNITGKYNELIINEKQILLASNIGNFYLKDISTGAKEQLLFALRVSLTKDILNDFAFFIFDDAFQHSDYDRRPKLVDQLFNLSDEGWQIIYLTMDDNIRDIFLNKGKNNKNFQEIILGTSTSNDLLSTLF